MDLYEAVPGCECMGVVGGGVWILAGRQVRSGVACSSVLSRNLI